jgi:uncharacterized membrane protein
MIVTLLTLILASLLSTAIVAVRWFYSGAPAYLFLLWNLFLAWLPLFAALTAYGLRRRPLLAVGPAVFWLLFLPNAPYLLTDLMHLGRGVGVPLWYDLLMLLTFALTGLLLGFASLELMHNLVTERLGIVSGWLFAASCLGLSGVGVTIGRFLRWNSWDAVLRPTSLLADLLALLVEPWTHRTFYVFTLLLTMLLVVAYTALRSLRQPGTVSLANVVAATEPRIE